MGEELDFAPMLQVKIFSYYFFAFSNSTFSPSNFSKGVTFFDFPLPATCFKINLNFLLPATFLVLLATRNNYCCPQRLTSKLYMFLGSQPYWKSSLKHMDNMVSIPKQESMVLSPSNGDISHYEDSFYRFCPEFPGCLPVGEKRLQPAFRRRHPKGRTQTRSGTFTIDFADVTLGEVEYLLLTLHYLSQYVFPGYFPAVFRPAWLSSFKPTVELSVRARWFLLSLDGADRRTLSSFAVCGHEVCCNSQIAAPLRLRMSGRCMHCVCPLSEFDCRCRTCPYIPEHLLHL